MKILTFYSDNLGIYEAGDRVSTSASFAERAVQWTVPRLPEDSKRDTSFLCNVPVYVATHRVSVARVRHEYSISDAVVAVYVYTAFVQNIFLIEYCISITGMCVCVGGGSTPC